MREEDTARRIVANLPPCLTASESRRYYAAIFGDTKTGEELLRALITMGQLEQTTFQADLITNTESSRKWCKESITCPFLRITIRSHSLLKKKEKLYEYIKQNGNFIHQMYLCTENRNEDARLETMLLTMFEQADLKKMPQIINVSRQEETTYGLLSECSEDIIERMGQEIFLDYERMHPSGRGWSDLSAFEQRANYNSAMHIPTKLYLTGARIVKDGTREQEVFENNQQFLAYLTEERIGFLTRLEHLRWCAFYAVSGYSYLPGEEAHGRIHDKEKCRHACLVPWSELPRISIQYARDFIKEDRDRVIHLFEYVKNSGHVIERTTPELLSEYLRRATVSAYPRK